MVSEDDPIALLLRLAGPREAAAQKRSGRVRSEVWAHWRTEVRTVRRRRMIFRATVALGAAAAVVVVIARGPWNPNRTFRGAGGPVASLLRAEGSFRLTGGRSLAIGASLLAGSELETGARGRAALALPGGHSVRLDSETRVRLLSGPALQLDRGALYVDSGPGRPRPTAVEIRTEMGLVRDVGTQFEVRLEGNELRLSVREGVANLTRAGQTFAAPAGTRLLVRTGGAVETHAVPRQGPEWDWVLAIAPRFDLEGRTLAEYLDWITRETGWRVEYAEPAIARDASTIVLHGSITGLRPDQTPLAVLPTCGLRHRLTDGTLTIERQAGAAGPS